MKHSIRDASQIVLAILLTTSMVVANAQSPPAQTHTVTKPVVIVAKPTPAPTQTAPAPVPAVQTDNPAPVVETPVVAPVIASNTTPSGSNEDLMAQAGIAASDFGAADFIISHEGHYDPCVRYGGAVDCGYATDGGGLAYGVCQALPGSKMASAGDDWATNAVTQLKWCNSYAIGRYGSWQSAYVWWIGHNSW